MIALADGMPLMQLEDGRVMAFQRDWLLRALLQAASKAGYQKWWLAEHVAESVMAYLALHFEGNIVTVPQLVSAVQSVLEVIGYSEVAPHVAPGAPGARLSLMQLAQEAGTGYELAFFDGLGRQLQTLLKGGTTFFELVGLAPCVKTLCARKCWSRGCDALQDEIVSFVRKQTAAAGDSHEEITIRLF